MNDVVTHWNLYMDCGILISDNNSICTQSASWYYQVRICKIFNRTYISWKNYLKILYLNLNFKLM